MTDIQIAEPAIRFITSTDAEKNFAQLLHTFAVLSLCPYPQESAYTGALELILDVLRLPHGYFDNQIEDFKNSGMYFRETILKDGKNPVVTVTWLLNDKYPTCY